MRFVCVCVLLKKCLFVHRKSKRVVPRLCRNIELEGKLDEQAFRMVRKQKIELHNNGDRRDFIYSLKIPGHQFQLDTASMVYLFTLSYSMYVLYSEFRANSS